MIISYFNTLINMDNVTRFERCTSLHHTASMYRIEVYFVGKGEPVYMEYPNKEELDLAWKYLRGRLGDPNLEGTLP